MQPQPLLKTYTRKRRTAQRRRKFIFRDESSNEEQDFYTTQQTRVEGEEQRGVDIDLNLLVAETEHEEKLQGYLEEEKYIFHNIFEDVSRIIVEGAPKIIGEVVQEEPPHEEFYAAIGVQPPREEATFVPPIEAAPLPPEKKRRKTKTTARKSVKYTRFGISEELVESERRRREEMRKMTEEDVLIRKHIFLKVFDILEQRALKSWQIVPFLPHKPILSNPTRRPLEKEPPPTTTKLTVEPMEEPGSLPADTRLNELITKITTEINERVQEQIRRIARLQQELKKTT